MHFPNTIVCLSSLLMITAFAGTPTSFGVPSSVPSTVATPAVDTTVLYETSTYYLTSAITLTVPAASEPANSSSCTDESTTTLTPSVVVSDNTTLTPVTLWEGTTTRVVYPQNSTVPAVPTDFPNSTTIIAGTSTVVNKTVVFATKTATGTSSSKDETSATASVSEVPVNGAGRGAGSVVLGLGAAVGAMALF
ncbi:hypothetical protein SVAN01_06085 [Stagonosporopsis vannaccii]|nr:hypothetical protein SVAN01_06085 [Stagonosporopsis vannaccii]